MLSTGEKSFTDTKCPPIKFPSLNRNVYKLYKLIICEQFDCKLEVSIGSSSNELEAHSENFSLWSSRREAKIVFTETKKWLVTEA